ncbi:MAG: C-terminal target protein, partial [Bacteroidota bacterium]|nr:C-terminal target protein [Bacteroidota bacterium]
MKKIYLLSFIIIILSITVQSAPVLLQNDNGTIKDSYPVRTNWEETVYLIPNGPCSVEEIQIYFVGEFPNSDTLFIVGDPSEGAVPPTLWCQPYNNKIMPIEFEYDGKPGWRTFKVNGLRSDGFDPFVIQHRIRENGCMFAVDNNGLSSPVRSWLMNPLQQNSLGGPGQYYYADGDYLVRVLVNYDLPDGNTSQPPPPPVLTDITKDAGLVNTSGNPINATEASVVDWNNDGFDDIAIGGNFFQNNGDGTFKNVTSAMKISAGATSWADIDNDGDLDVYALVGGSYNQAATMVNNQSKVYKNNGDGSFTVILNKDLFRLPYPSPGKEFNSLQYDQDSVPNPYSCITPLLLDANGDGRLDIFFANNRVGFNNSSNQSEERYFPDKLWLQDNSGQFYDVTAGSGIAAGEPFSPGTLWFGYYDCYGANACDYNLDNKTDIFVANYRLAKDNLYQNTGGGTFTEAAASTGVQGVLTPCQIPGYFGHGMGAEWADFNNDGYPDLCVGNLGHPDWRGANSNSSLIFKNNGPQGNYSFEEVHDVLGLKFFEMNAGVLWADLDLDGFQDLWHGQISYYTEGSNGEPRRRGH